MNDVVEMRCGCIYFEVGASVRCADHPGDDDCAHAYEPTSRVWPGTIEERLTETCKKCGDCRGRTH